MQYAERWQEELQKGHPKRHYKTSVIDVNGKNVFLTRYFKALKPPPEVAEKASEKLQSVSCNLRSHVTPKTQVVRGICE